MKKITLKNRGISILIAFIIMIATIMLPAPAQVEAATEFIDSDVFVKKLVQALKLEVDTTSDKPYLEAATKVGIVKTEELKNYYFLDISKTTAAVLINRADEYLHGDTVNIDLVNIILNKRISDIEKVSEGEREAVAKCFAKGIIKGYSNGYYIQNRKFKGDEYLTTADAKTLINRLVNTKRRAKVSPDGMLIRTTNLPKNADNYEYILACYPNKFYERKFEFMFSNQYIAGERDPIHQIYPVDMRSSTFKTWNEEWPFSIEMDKYLYDWTEKAETYLKYLFNVDYRTVDDIWIEGLASCYAKSNIDEAASIRRYYLKHIKANKVIVESSIIAVEPSTLYDDGDYCMRAYVRYRITADDISVKQNRLLRCQYPALDNLKSGVWREGIFDIRFGTNNGYQGDGSYFAIDDLTNYVDEYNVPVE